MLALYRSIDTDRSGVVEFCEFARLMRALRRAIEAGGKGDFDRIMQGLKHKRGGPIFSREKLTNDVKDLQERMEQAVEDDDKAAAEEPPRPAIAKVAMLPEVEALLRKKQYHETRGTPAETAQKVLAVRCSRMSAAAERDATLTHTITRSTASRRLSAPCTR